MSINKHWLSRRSVLSASRRGMAIYLYVATIAMLVSVLALAASEVVRIERRQAATLSDRLAARSLAHAAVELGFRAVKSTSNWRNAYVSGSYTTPANVAGASAGTVSWRLQDTDGSLLDGDTQLRLTGVGRVGGAVQATSVQLAASPVGPSMLRSYTASGSSDDLTSDKWWGQYFKPTLPADAHVWWVSSVELYANKVHSSRTLRVRLYQPNGSNMPSTTIMDEANLNSDDFGSSAWHQIAMTGTYAMLASEGLCLAVETTAAGTPISLQYASGGVAEADSALLRGTPGWNSYETDKALRYRINGFYTTHTGVTRAFGTYTWDGN